MFMSNTMPRLLFHPRERTWGGGGGNTMIKERRFNGAFLDGPADPSGGGEWTQPDATDATISSDMTRGGWMEAGGGVYEGQPEIRAHMDGKEVNDT